MASKNKKQEELLRKIEQKIQTEVLKAFASNPEIEALKKSQDSNLPKKQVRSSMSPLGQVSEEELKVSPDEEMLKQQRHLEDKIGHL